MSQESILVEPSSSATQQPAQTTQQTAPPVKLDEIKLPVDDSIDATYRGKSAAELIEMHKNAQSRIGAQGQELGVWRNLVSELSTVTRQAPPTTAQETALKVTSDELLTNPVEAISKVVSRELQTALKPIKESRELDRQENELQALNRDFPNMRQIGDDPEFQSWSMKSPGRSADARAVQKGDSAAARRLLEAWQDRQELLKGANRTTTPEGGKPQGVDGAKTVVTESGGGGRSNPTGKIFNRAEVVQLIIDKPEVYASDEYQRELLQAAKEGRIR